MCNAETTRICDNLQAIGIATCANPEFSAWVNEVSLRLDHPAAITCTREEPAFWLSRIHAMGFDSTLVASILNQRYQRGYLQTLK